MARKPPAAAAETGVLVEVTGRHDIDGHPPGSRFRLPDDPRLDQLVTAGHLTRVTAEKQPEPDPGV